MGQGAIGFGKQCVKTAEIISGPYKRVKAILNFIIEVLLHYFESVHILCGNKEMQFKWWVMNKASAAQEKSRTGYNTFLS
jgi:hypothetical protein